MLTHSLIESHYFPSLEYLALLSGHPAVLIAQHEWYVKQTPRNRTHILTSQGVLPLIVPIRHTGAKHSMWETQIDYAQHWQRQHWRAIESAYRKAPFYEHYAPSIHAVLHARHASLLALNIATLRIAIESFALPFAVELAECCQLVVNNDYRNVLTDRKNHAQYPFYEAKPYYQLFGTVFVYNLSFMDLLFCMGPHSKHYFLKHVD